MLDMLQVGTIAYRDKQTKDFADAKPLYMKHSPEFAKALQEFLQDACDMFITDLLIYAKYGF